MAQTGLQTSHPVAACICFKHIGRPLVLCSKWSPRPISILPNCPSKKPMFFCLCHPGRLLDHGRPRFFLKTGDACLLWVLLGSVWAGASAKVPRVPVVKRL
jgi:hypothetical protein